MNELTLALAFIGTCVVAVVLAILLVCLYAVTLAGIRWLLERGWWS